MRKTARTWELFLLEMQRSYKMFFFYMVILGLLFSVISAVFELANNIPDELFREMENTQMDTMDINKVTMEDMDYLDELDIYVYSYLDQENTLSIENFSMSEKVKDFGDINTTGAITHWNGKKSEEPLQINKKLLAGNKWNGDTEQENGIWIEETLAKSLGVAIGSTMEYVNHEGEKTGNVIVKGIYKFDEMLDAFYIPISEYVQLENLSNYLTVIAKPLQAREILSVVKKLEERKLKVEYCKTELESVQFIVYLLYGTNILLIFTVICILSDFIRIYCRRREPYFGMLMSFGIHYMSLKKVVLYYVECLLCVAALISLWGSTFFYQYITKYVNYLFENLLNEESGTHRSNLGVWIIFGLFAFIYVSVSIRYMKNIEVDKLLEE